MSSFKYIFLVDASGSMGGSRLTEAMNYIRTLKPDDCQIYPFSDDLEAPLSFNNLNELHTIGGTCIIHCLRKMFNIVLTEGQNIYFYLLTDAEDSCTNDEVKEMEILQEKVKTTLSNNGYYYRRKLWLLHAGGMKPQLEQIFGTTVEHVQDGDLKAALAKSAEIQRKEQEMEIQVQQIGQKLNEIQPKQADFVEKIESISKEAEDLKQSQDTLSKDIESMKSSIETVRNLFQSKNEKLTDEFKSTDKKTTSLISKNTEIIEKLANLQNEIQKKMNLNSKYQQEAIIKLNESNKQENNLNETKVSIEKEQEKIAKTKKLLEKFEFDSPDSEEQIQAQYSSQLKYAYVLVQDNTRAKLIILKTKQKIKETLEKNKENGTDLTQSKMDVKTLNAALVKSLDDEFDAI